MLKLATLFVFVVAGTLVAAPSQASTRLDGVNPTVFSCSLKIAQPGQTVTFTVLLSGAANGTEQFAVNAASGQFASIPTEVGGVAGSDEITFQGKLSSTAKGAIQVSVSGNGGLAQTQVAVSSH